MPLRLIHQFFSSSLSYFLFVHCCPSKDTLRETRMRSYLLLSIRAKMEFLPWLLSPKQWPRPFYLGTGSQSSTALTKGEEPPVSLSSVRELSWGFPALPLGYSSNLVDVLLTLMRLANQPYFDELLKVQSVMKRSYIGKCTSHLTNCPRNSAVVPWPLREPCQQIFLG